MGDSYLGLNTILSTLICLQFSIIEKSCLGDKTGLYQEQTIKTAVHQEKKIHRLVEIKLACIKYIIYSLKNNNICVPSICQGLGIEE